MDRNSILGVIIIMFIIFGWMYLSAPSKEELAQQKRVEDSLARVAIVKEVESNSETTAEKEFTDSTTTDSILNVDSLKQAKLTSKFGVFSNAVNDSDRYFTIENEYLLATISSKGGRICSVELKEYKKYDSTPLVLFDKDSSSFGLDLETDLNQFNTSQFYFKPVGKSFFVSEAQSNSLTMRLQTNNNQFIDFIYTLKGKSYLVDFKIDFSGMNSVIVKNANTINMNWFMRSPSLEKSHKNQQIASTIYFKYNEEDPDYLSETKSETKSLDAKTKWIAFKQQYFSSAIIAKDIFDKTNGAIASINEADSSKYVKSFSANVSIPFSGNEKESFEMQFFFGPNHYQSLKEYGLGLEKLVPLGWGIFGWVNKFLVIPVFNFLDGFNLNYGIIILLLTIIIKLLLFPIAYKTYMSSAKMKVLKPEIDELNKKFEKEDPMKKQSATMELYRKAGVNPLAGCIPVLLQMPILIALIRFFPSSIELRQQAFLWAEDLSTYDSIWEFGYVPVINSIYGDHVSLFALLMTFSTLLYTWSNNQLMGSTNQMPGMKFMMYAMPFVFLGFLNNYSAGLSYYYFLANMITFGQTSLMKLFVDENELRRKIEEHKKKPVKRSSFQQRLEQIQKDQKKKMANAKKK